jgi:RHS repeat-associated protein
MAEFSPDEQTLKVSGLVDELFERVLYDEEPLFVSDEATLWGVWMGDVDEVLEAGGPGLEMLIRPQHEGAPGLAFETWDIATMQAPGLVRGADTSMMSPLPCLSSEASASTSISTGKERDQESGNDYFGARYYSSTMGSWLSPEYSMNSAITELPQTWNKYSYEYNRPTYGSDPNGYCPPCVGALIGGVVEGGFDLGKQLYNNGGSLSKVSWGKVGANTLGGAVAGGLAVATGGASLVESAVVGDIAAGGTANVVGGVVTRVLDPNTPSDDVLSAGAISQDALAGFVGGGAGHLAGEFVHVPDEPIHNGLASTGAIRRDAAKFARYNNAVANQITRATVGASAATHTTSAGFSLWNWLMFSPPPQQPNATVTTSECDTLPDGSQHCY